MVVLTDSSLHLISLPSPRWVQPWWVTSMCHRAMCCATPSAIRPSERRGVRLSATGGAASCLARSGSEVFVVHGVVRPLFLPISATTFTPTAPGATAAAVEGEHTASATPPSERASFCRNSLYR